MTGFADTLHGEWTKFRTVRGWVFGVLAAAAAILAFGLLPGVGGSCTVSPCTPLFGPDGTEVSDSFTVVHQPLAGDGSITVRVAALTGELPGTGPGRPAIPGLVPWAKAGLIIKNGTTPGSTYAAVMVTGDHGVRMQYDYTHDIAGNVIGAPHWLRLTRGGDTVTAAESADGSRWTDVGRARLPGLPATAEVGVFVTSPQYFTHNHRGLAVGSEGGPSRATGTFDHLAVQGGWTAAVWRSDRLGAPGNEAPGNQAPGTQAPGNQAPGNQAPGSQAPGNQAPDTRASGDKAPGNRTPPSGDGLDRAGGVLRVTGSGDIAPSVAGDAGAGVSVTQTLVGTFVGLILVVVVATMFVTAEYRRGLIRTSFAADPGRVRLLVAKAVVVGGVTFGVGLVAAATVVLAGQRVLRDNGVYVHPAPLPTEVRIVAGTAALLAVAAIMAVGVGAVLRRGVTAVTTAVVVIVLPYLLALTALSGTAGNWLLRISPAAAFALQQALRQYPQVDNAYTPSAGYFPLPGWAGLAVLAGWSALAFAAAAILVRRGDA